MAGRLATPAALLAVAAALLVPSASAKSPWAADLSAISRGLDRAVAAGHLDEDTAASYREIAGRASTALPRLPSSRYRNLSAVVHEVAVQARLYDQPRGYALFSMLNFNVRWLGEHWDRPAGTDIIDTDGVLYRAFPGIGFQFHPLGNFGRLNWLIGSRRDERAERLAEELVQRGVARTGGLAWEYYFRFSGGRPPWISGMAQAVAAQALSRVGKRLERPDILAAAGRAYATVPKLLRVVAGRPWIRLYAFSGETVLNAQLQSIVSLQDFFAQTGDARAQELADRLQSAATALLPRFDTGSWSRYSLGGPESTLDYHRFVVKLLKLLVARTSDPVLTAYSTKFGAYLTEPPVVEAGRSPEPVYPWPADGFRDEARISFWISKRSNVRVVVGDGRTKPVRVPRGWNTIPWRPGAVEPGTYLSTLHAVDIAGNSSETELAPVVVRRDTTPPRLNAAVRKARVYWRALDRETPWLSLRLVLRRGGEVRTLSLGRRWLHGSAALKVPRGAWSGTLVASDSSGNSAAAAVGLVRGRG
ncbi:MAG: D-glucuronyl C5-epimerase family protein [Actinomycetota bacterium]|nr:D-glucuronyl C5-epimerase family protein [Actinomycetota bacterium]